VVECRVAIFTRVLRNVHSVRKEMEILEEFLLQFGDTSGGYIVIKLGKRKKKKKRNNFHFFEYI
jgi:hypothetical protein